MSILSLVQVMTGEDWTDIVFSVMAKGEWLGAVVIIFWFLFSNYILLQASLSLVFGSSALCEVRDPAARPPEPGRGVCGGVAVGAVRVALPLARSLQLCTH